MEPDPWQEEACKLFQSPRPEDRRIALQACVGPGKSAVLAWCGWWFLAVQGRRGEHPKGLITSITKDNLQGNLWAEYSKWQARSPYLRTQFTWTTSAIFSSAYPATWRLEARSWPKTANPEQQGQTFSGLHGEYVLVQVDEAGNVPVPVLRAAEQALSVCRFGKLGIAGNPTSLEGMLYAAAVTLADQWRVVRVTGDPEDPKAWTRTGRALLAMTDGASPLDWAKQQIEQYGRDNPWVKTQILGLFPDASINSLLGIEDVNASMERKLRADEYNWVQKRLGVDVARFGDDRSVIFPRQGLRAFKPDTMRNFRTTQIAARVALIQDNWKDNAVTFVDDTGAWGHGVIDALITANRHSIGVVFSDKAADPRYFNRRAEMWMKMADWVKGGGWLPRLPSIKAELTEPTYTFHKGAFLIEDKDQIKKRIGRSPDLADALALTFAMPDTPMEFEEMGAADARRRGERRSSSRTARAVTQDELDEREGR